MIIRQTETQGNHQQTDKAKVVSRTQALQVQDERVRSRLFLATVSVLLLSILIVIHEVFVLIQMPQQGIHSVAHVLLLIMAGIIIVSSKILWKSYHTLKHYQASIISRYDALEQTVGQRTRQLEKSESVLLSMFNAFDERTVVVDPNMRITQANRAAIDWVGYDPSGHLFSEVFPECDPASERRSEQALIKGTFDTGNIHRNRIIRGGKDCASVLSTNTYPVISSHGEVHAVIEIARDVTRETEEDILEKHKEKMASLGMLAAGFVHELGNPLTALSTGLELLERNPDKSSLLELLAAQKEHLQRMARTLQQIRDFAQKRSTGTKEADIQEVLRDTLRLVQFDPRGKGVQIHTEVAEGLSRITMTEDELSLILVNLIINAFDAMPDSGALTITAEPDKIGGICLTVSDTGVGMAREVLSKATFPLFTTKRDAGGSGLGLAMCTELLHAAGARLNISTTPGKGTTVNINFPGSDKQH